METLLREGLTGLSKFQWSAPLSPVSVNRLAQVYTQLTFMMAISAATCYAYLVSDLLYSLANPILCLLGLVGCMLFFAFTPATPENLQKRQGILYAFALFKGLSLAPLIQMSLAINPANIFIALSSVALLFLCFTASVLYSPDRRPMMLFTAALISSLSGMAFWMMLVNMFLWSSSIMWMEMYVGLALFSLYVVMDTQMMLVRAESGDKDYLRDVLNLYVDLVQMFVRILIILTRKEQDKREKNEKRRNR